MTNSSKLDRMTSLSLIMSKFSLLVITVAIIINTFSWLKPELILEKYGLGYSLTGRILPNFDMYSFNWWQLTGGIFITSIPLSSLIFSLWALHQLFRRYGQGDYFSRKTAKHLGFAAWGVIAWSILDILCEPLLTLWLTMNASAGSHFISFSLTTGHFVAFFMSACLAIISRILYQACDIYAENQSII
ncbi:DUF2975 domain-containing protein [Photorhabdus australis]|uniref:DUF2975 domain-containing protein n=1 Tax=Photorhabdus australis TaxID=286156 RepID=UPI000689A8F7|nr:DUF2975 domain-containing protein [Photorhabdus australis]